jgi:hypothetical protein
VAISLLVTDRSLVLQGDPITDWTRVDCTRRWNTPGSGTVDLPAHPHVMEQLQPGNRIVVIRDGAVWIAGPMEIPADFAWSVGSDPGRVSVNFADDLALIAGRITYPDPSLPAGHTSQPANRVYSSTNRELILRDLVNTNAGPGALGARQIPQLALGAIAGIGSTTTFRTRFRPLGDELRAVAAGDQLGFRTRQSGQQILFEVYSSTDRSRTARFSRGLGNLRSIRLKQSAPMVTSVIVGGGGEGSSRVIVEVTDDDTAAEWYRVERFADRRDIPDDTNGELTRAGEATLGDGAQPVELAVATADTPDLRAGVDYDLGDIVAISPVPGMDITDVVRSIHLQATPGSGEYVSALVGSPESTSDPAMVAVVRDLGRRLARIESR